MEIIVSFRTLRVSNMWKNVHMHLMFKAIIIHSRFQIMILQLYLLWHKNWGRGQTRALV